MNVWCHNNGAIHKVEPRRPLHIGDRNYDKRPARQKVEKEKKVGDEEVMMMVEAGKNLSKHHERWKLELMMMDTYYRQKPQHFCTAMPTRFITRKGQD
jgi:hypothetical protein